MNSEQLVIFELRLMELQKVITKQLFVGILEASEERAGSGSVIQWCGSADRDTFQNVTDPEH